MPAFLSSPRTCSGVHGAANAAPEIDAHRLRKHGCRNKSGMTGGGRFTATPSSVPWRDRRGAARSRARCRHCARSAHGPHRECPIRAADRGASARRRRFMRLRTTALPIFLVTVYPICIDGSPSARSRTSRTKPGIGARFPAFAARKSRRIRRVVRLTASCGRDCGERESRCGHPESPSATGNRAGARAPDCSAERSASSFIPWSSE